MNAVYNLENFEIDKFLGGVEELIAIDEDGFTKPVDTRLRSRRAEKF